jgi:hypothetical protein
LYWFFMKASPGSRGCDVSSGDGHGEKAALIFPRPEEVGRG